MARQSRGQQTAGQLTRFAAGALVATANTAFSGWLRGAQAGAQATARMAQASRGLVPGARLAGEVAALVERRAAASRQGADQLARRGQQLWRETTANASPSAQDPGSPAPLDTTVNASGENGIRSLISDSTSRPIDELTELAVEVGNKLTLAATTSNAGRRVLESAITSRRLAGHAKSRQPPTAKEVDEIRRALRQIALDSGSEGLRYLGHVAKALAGTGLGEPRLLGQLLAETLAQVRQLADLGEMEGFMPAPLADPKLQAQLRQMAANPPHKLLRELAGEAPGWQDLGALSRAIAEDSEAIGQLVLNYPRVLVQLARTSGHLVLSGGAELGEVEAFWRGRRFEAWPQSSDRERADSRPERER